MFHALLFGVIPAAAIVGLALYGAVSGRPTFWDSWIKKTAARMHTFGLIGAGVLAAGLWGISAVTAAAACLRWRVAQPQAQRDRARRAGEGGATACLTHDPRPAHHPSRRRQPRRCGWTGRRLPAAP